MSPRRIALFDLDHTLLSGDTDVLWCEFLMARGVIPRESFERRNQDIEARYKLGQATAAEFTHFYVSTLAGRSPAQWEPLRAAFMAGEILPRIPRSARALVRSHQEAGDLVVLTSATNRFLTERTAEFLGIAHLLGSEPELRDGVFTGATTGVLNMREGKVVRLHAWLAERGESLADFASTAYSDSINDLPLLEAVDLPVAVNADARLAAIAAERGWRTLSLREGSDS